MSQLSLATAIGVRRLWVVPVVVGYCYRVRRLWVVPVVVGYCYRVGGLWVVPVVVGYCYRGEGTMACPNSERVFTMLSGTPCVAL